MSKEEIQELDSFDRLKRLDAIYTKIHKDKHIFIPQEERGSTVRFVETGCYSLDYVLGGGRNFGVPSGKIIELSGQYSTGKTLLASFIASSYQKQNKVGK